LRGGRCQNRPCHGAAARAAKCRRDRRRAASSGGCSGCRCPRAHGHQTKAGVDRYRIGANPIGTDSIALVVKKWAGQAGRDGATFAKRNLQRGAISSRVVQGVHIARLKQFSGHASLKSIEEYLELDQLQQHPLKDVL
jgi:hypothetical protein